eukprot:TRINITY_DN49237_c0_g1_i1.p2 TRINITY_DN49237_c0_g1~~TRINITY_DN49237_c0_g1_i1.p2  ORF type:complete len:165 (-),score=12.69 TRINITY_DN49237_c0_g1_i1:103-528(-)
MSSRNCSVPYRELPTLCRFCWDHAEEPQLLYLGCGCKDNLGVSHKECAKRWFIIKQNNICEVCLKPCLNIPDEPHKTKQLDEFQKFVRDFLAEKNRDRSVECWQATMNFLGKLCRKTITKEDEQEQEEEETQVRNLDWWYE